MLFSSREGPQKKTDGMLTGGTRGEYIKGAFTGLRDPEELGQRLGQHHRGAITSPNYRARSSCRDLREQLWLSWRESATLRDPAGKKPGNKLP